MKICWHQQIIGTNQFLPVVELFSFVILNSGVRRFGRCVCVWGGGGGEGGGGGLEKYWCLQPCRVAAEEMCLGVGGGGGIWATPSARNSKNIELS